MSKCFNCEYQKNVPGDAHISCGHPKMEEANKSPVFSMVALLNPNIAVNAMGMEASEYGVKSGWCQFPSNYDPVWLSGECSGFKSK